ncbi:MAG: hypothetical protein Q7J68_04415 [Thermoplasmata archaeon]|nr:hypothetical protein [Thermoplasmata archaeon]
MHILSEEEKAYILEAGERWDGKTVYDRIKGINKNANEAVEELIWLFENMENIRGCLDREFKSKYGDPKRRWEGKDSPQRSSFKSYNIISQDNIEKLLKLYIIESEDIKRSMRHPRWRKDDVVRVEKSVEELKESLISMISGVKLKFD